MMMLLMVGTGRVAGVPAGCSDRASDAGCPRQLVLRVPLLKRPQSSDCAGARRSASRPNTRAAGTTEPRARALWLAWPRCAHVPHQLRGASATGASASDLAQPFPRLRDTCRIASRGGEARFCDRVPRICPRPDRGARGHAGGAFRRTASTFNGSRWGSQQRYLLAGLHPSSTSHTSCRAVALFASPRSSSRSLDQRVRADRRRRR